MAGEIRGPVRFRFRLPDEEIDIRLEGDSEWVNTIRDEFGLAEVGWLQPLAINSVSINRASSNNDVDDEPEDVEDEEQEELELSPDTSGPRDMGPPPDPSRIPVVRIRKPLVR